MLHYYKQQPSTTSTAPEAAAPAAAATPAVAIDVLLPQWHINEVYMQHKLSELDRDPMRHDVSWRHVPVNATGNETWTDWTPVPAGYTPLHWYTNHHACMFLRPHLDYH